MALPGYEEFELDLTAALREKLPPIFDRLKAQTLTIGNVHPLPQVQGVYMLLLDGKPTYIGKTDAKHGFRQRLERHFFTLSSRRNLDLSRVTFKAVRVMVFTTVNVEATLIGYYGIDRNPASWQLSGFGSNDPGRNREQQEPSAFDVAFPINVDLPLLEVPVGRMTVWDALGQLKKHLPYLLRMQSDAQAKGELKSRWIDVPSGSWTMLSLVTQHFLPAIPVGWAFVFFPSRVILYKSPAPYAYATLRMECTGRT